MAKQYMRSRAFYGVVNHSERDTRCRRRFCWESGRDSDPHQASKPGRIGPVNASSVRARTSVQCAMKNRPLAEPVGEESIGVCARSACPGDLFAAVHKDLIYADLETGAQFLDRP